MRARIWVGLLLLGLTATTTAAAQERRDSTANEETAERPERRHRHRLLRGFEHRWLMSPRPLIGWNHPRHPAYRWRAGPGLRDEWGPYGAPGRRLLRGRFAGPVPGWWWGGRDRGRYRTI